MHDGIVRNKWPITIQRDVWDSLAVLEGFRTGSWVVVEGLLDFHGSSEDSYRFSDLNGGGREVGFGDSQWVTGRLWRGKERKWRFNRCRCLPGSFRNMIHPVEWRSRRTAVKRMAPIHKWPKLRSSDRHLALVSSARIPAVLPPRSLSNQKKYKKKWLVHLKLLVTFVVGFRSSSMALERLKLHWNCTETPPPVQLSTEFNSNRWAASRTGGDQHWNRTETAPAPIWTRNQANSIRTIGSEPC